MRRVLICLTLICVAAPAVVQAQPGAQEEAPLTKLTLHPAPEPVPALRYQLLPGLLDRSPGNAATQYGRAALLVSERHDSKLEGQILELLKVPLDELPRQQANSLVHRFDGALREVEIAARRDTCEWDLPLEEGFAMLLPDLSNHRRLARVLALRARLEITEGKYGEAIHTLQTGLAMARHVGEAPTLIHGLVGIAIAAIMLDPLEELVQAPGSPNLYWALTLLPPRFVDMRGAMEVEMNALALQYPELRDPAKSRLTPLQWGEFAEEILTLATGHTWRNRAGAAILALVTYADAKRYLVEQGKTPQQVEAMPVLQVVAIYMVDGSRRVTDDHFKWFYVPYWQAREGLRDAELRESKDTVLAALLMPAISRAYMQMGVLDRRVAALRCVEAVRMYAAAHEGKLPRALSDITEVPIPVNPVTAEPFGYEVVGERAILSAPLARHDLPESGLRYELTIAP